MTDPDLDRLVIAVAHRLAHAPTTTPTAEAAAAYEEHGTTDAEGASVHGPATAQAGSPEQESSEPLSEELISAVAARLYSMLPDAALGLRKSGDDLPFVEIEI